MRIRVSLGSTTTDQLLPQQDLELDFSANTDVSEAARALVRAGAGNPALVKFAVRRAAPLTLRVAIPGHPPIVLDSAELLKDSGIRSGAWIQPMLEPAIETIHEEENFARPPIASLRVLSGAQAGVEFLLPHGNWLIGRATGSRIGLIDPSVSRTHARVVVDPGRVALHDLGSANGTRSMQRRSHSPAGFNEVERSPGGPSLVITDSEEVEFGIVRARITVRSGAARPASLPAPHSVLPSPRVDTVFNPEPLLLPSPPEVSEPNPLPLVAMATPVLGAILLLVLTNSPFALVFAALAPLALFGSWLDSRRRSRRTLRRLEHTFLQNLEHTRMTLTKRAELEEVTRRRESPGGNELLPLPTTLDSLLWSRRVEHRPFLECRLGLATLGSRQGLSAQARGSSASPHLDTLEEVRQRYREARNVPVTEQLHRCGSLGICGPAAESDAALRALVVQITALHSPSMVSIAVLANAEQSGQTWAWLKWLPHVGSDHSPLSGPHLSSDPTTASALLGSLEGLVQSRIPGEGASAPRSHLSETPGSASERQKPVTGPGHIPRIVLLVLSTIHADRERLVHLAEHGPNAGVHVLWLAGDQRGLPAACRTVVKLDPGDESAHFVRHGQVVRLSAIEAVGLRDAEHFARLLAPLTDAGAPPVSGGELPRSIALAQLLPAEASESPAAIRDRWQSTDSLTGGWIPGRARADSRLRAVIGLGTSGPCELDLRLHGPHALVAGTTGSGKSEFLQSWILSLASNYSPERLNFLLFDYKGGSAFSGCAELPHVVGVVTDLDSRNVERAFVSLRAELIARERLLREKGVQDLVTLERRSDPDAPANLVIIIDEFATLASENPSFVPGLIDIAQRGRSLGLHAILATQRPAGVVSEALRANTNLRVALRTTNAAESIDIIGSPEASRFSAESPGRAAVKIGGSQPVLVQAGFLGDDSARIARGSIMITDLGFSSPRPRDLLPEIVTPGSGAVQEVRDLDRLVAHIRAAAREAHCATSRRPWIDALPEKLLLSEIPPSSHASHSQILGAPAKLGLNLGLLDEPHRQRQVPFTAELSSRSNLLIFGAPHSGKSTALITAACSAIVAYPGARVYGLDCAGGALAKLAALPNTGAIITHEERNRVGRLIRMLREHMTAGEKEGTNQRRREEPRTSPTFFLVDDLSALYDAPDCAGPGDTVLSTITEIARAGRFANIHVIASTSRRAGIPAALLACFGEQLALRLSTDIDAQLLGLPSETGPGRPPGRALRVGTGQELQIALPVSSNYTGDNTQLEQEIGAFADRLRVQNLTIVRPPSIPPVPAMLPRSKLPVRPNHVAGFALDTDRYAGVSVPGQGTLLVTGPAGAGRSTTILTMLESISEELSVTGQLLETALLTPRRSSLTTAYPWGSIGDDPSSRRELTERLTAGARASNTGNARTAALTRGSGLSTARFATPTSRVVIVIEDLGSFEGSGEETSVASLLKALRHSEFTTIVEGENATLASAWELTNPLKGTRWAIALRPDANDTPSLFTTPFQSAKRTDFPPGHGYLIYDGNVTEIQVTVPGSPDPDHHHGARSKTKAGDTPHTQRLRCSPQHPTSGRER